MQLQALGAAEQPQATCAQLRLSAQHRPGPLCWLLSLRAVVLRGRGEAASSPPQGDAQLSHTLPNAHSPRFTRSVLCSWC